MTVAFGEAEAVALAWIVATIVMALDDGTVSGLAWTPAEEITPTVLSPPAVLLALQVTEVFVEPPTLAAICCDSPTAAIASAGLAGTLTPDRGFLASGPPLPPQPVNRQRSPTLTAHNIVVLLFALGIIQARRLKSSFHKIRLAAAMRATTQHERPAPAADGSRLGAELHADLSLQA